MTPSDRRPAPPLLPGEVYPGSRLTPVHEAPGQDRVPPSHRVWACRCSCGRDRAVAASVLRQGHVTRCRGCRTPRAAGPPPPGVCGGCGGPRPPGRGWYCGGCRPARARQAHRDPARAAGLRAEAARLRAEGKVLREIAAALGVSKEWARRLLLPDPPAAGG